MRYVRVLILVLVAVVCFGPREASGSQLPIHTPLCTDDARNALLWRITYAGSENIHLPYSPLNNAYQRPFGIDKTQPTHYLSDAAVYFWAPLGDVVSEHRWVLAGNAQAINPVTLPSCLTALKNECIPDVYDYCDSADVATFCRPISCNVESNTCDQLHRECPAETPVCVDDLRMCVECLESSDCQAMHPISFCEGGWHCSTTTHTCEQTPPPCNPAEAHCDATTRTCRKFSCSSHADCDDGNPCNGNELCDFSLHSCYKDPDVPVPCDGDPQQCDTASGKCHECSTDIDCQSPGTMLYPCEPRRGCGVDTGFPTRRVCENRPPLVSCDTEADMHCDNISGTCVICTYDEDCWPAEVRSGQRSLRYCDGEFYCHKNECVHYGRCTDEQHAYCLEDSHVCSECESDDDCTSDSFCRPTRHCNHKSGRCEDGDDPCDTAAILLANGNIAELPTKCDEASRTCIQEVLCMDDSHCVPKRFCSPGERCNLYTGQCEIALRDENGTILPISTCGDQPCLEDEQRCGYPRNVIITVSALGAAWLVMISILLLLCACMGKLS